MGQQQALPAASPIRQIGEFLHHPLNKILQKIASGLHVKL